MLKSQARDFVYAVFLYNCKSKAQAAAQMLVHLEYSSLKNITLQIMLQEAQMFIKLISTSTGHKFSSQSISDQRMFVLESCLRRKKNSLTGIYKF